MEPASRFRQNLMPLFDVRVRRRRQQSSWAGRGVCKTIRAAQSSPEVSPNRPGCAAARRGGRWCRMAGRRGQGGLAGVRHLLQSRRDLAPHGGASEGPQIAGLAVWPSGGAVDSGSVVPRGGEGADGGVPGRRLVELLGCTAVGTQVLPWGPLGGLRLLAPLCSFSEPVGPLGPYALLAYSHKTGPQGALQ